MDAAYAGAAAVVPETRRYFQGLEHVDSFNMNAHKWLLTNFDCSPLWVKRSEPLKQALSLTPPYLRAKGNALDLKAGKTTCPSLPPAGPVHLLAHNCIIHVAVGHKSEVCRTWSYRLMNKLPFNCLL